MRSAVSDQSLSVERPMGISAQAVSFPSSAILNRLGPTDSPPGLDRGTVTRALGALSQAWMAAEASLPPGWRLEGVTCASTGLQAEQRSDRCLTDCGDR